MKNTLGLILIIFTFFQWGCNSNKFLLLKDSPECNTTIEGKFTTPKVYKYYGPAVLFNKGYKYNYEMGSVVRQNDNGIFLRKKSYSFLDSPDTLFIEFPKIRAIIDSNNFCVYGDIEDDECSEMSLKFYLEKTDEASYQPIYLELVSNEYFSFCVKPGSYKIKKIVKEISSDYYYESFPVFDCKIEAIPNRANYIGDIKLFTKENVPQNAYVIPYFKQVKSENAGAAFGLIGGLIANMSNSAWKDEIKGYFYFDVSKSEGYHSESKNILNAIPLKIEVKY